MARQVYWSKRRGIDVWATKIPSWFNLGDKKIQLVVHAGRRHSTAHNSNARLEVNISDGTPRGFKPLLNKEFNSSWQAKEFIDCMLTMLHVLNLSEEETFDWFVSTLSKVPFIMAPPPSTAVYHTIQGYPN